eukprot:TRINITY_DN11649_c0_g1_i1.p1 TRINITY_DN11649_c0_g1~~TRINITY_DN11649_c0_g1_i1.p1  ORF type:complete len:131 (+),score=20.33 TRINITY_DN11649_c0_g1_i1:29-394(+)
MAVYQQKLPENLGLPGQGVKGPAPHPVAHIEDNYDMNQERLQNFALSNTFGQHMPIRMQMEKHTLSQQHTRPMPFPQRNHGMDTLSGADESIHFSDFLNDPRETEVHPPSFHTVMEARLGM